jgi:hypothetical protein
VIGLSSYHQHVKCGGDLEFHHKEDRKTFYLCNKCEQSVNCALCPSYNQYVLSGRVRVTREEYHRIKSGVRTK